MHSGLIDDKIEGMFKRQWKDFFKDFFALFTLQCTVVRMAVTFEVNEQKHTVKFKDTDVREVE